MRARALVEAESLKLFRKLHPNPGLSETYPVALRYTRRNGETGARIVHFRWELMDYGPGYRVAFTSPTEAPSELTAPANPSETYSWDFIAEIITYAIHEGPDYAGVIEDDDEDSAFERSPADIVRVEWKADKAHSDAAQENVWNEGDRANP